MEEDHRGMESSPMDLVFSWSESRREGKSCSKRKYQEDSGYITTPCSSQSASGLTWGLGTPDDGFSESPRGKLLLHEGCDSPRDWEDWEKGAPLLPSSPEAPVLIPNISPMRPKILRARDLPGSGSSGFSLRRPVCHSRYERVHNRSDFIHRFSVASNVPSILSLIFSYLPDRDITSMTMVSKTWYDYITNDKDTRQRWLNNVALRKSSKENLSCFEKDSWVRSPLKIRNHSTPLRRPTSSPPVSPSKFRFNLFRKEAEKLGDGECLMHCPSCDLPSRCTPVEKRGKCIRVGCALEFCTDCRNSYHSGSPCVLLSPPGNRTPQKRISAAQSRRNLRRLL